MATRRVLVLITVFVVAVLGGAVVGLAVQGSDEQAAREAASPVGLGATVDGGSPDADGGVGVPDGSTGTSGPTGAGGGAQPAPPDPGAPDPPPVSPTIPPLDVKKIQQLLAPSITASVSPSSGHVWHGGAKGLCLDPGSGATYFVVDAHVHVGYGRSIASVSGQYAPNDVSDLTPWVSADGALSYSVAFNGYLPGPYTMTLTLKDNKGVTAHFVKPFVVHDCAAPA